MKSDIVIISKLQIGVKHPVKLLWSYMSGNQDQCREFDPQDLEKSPDRALSSV